MNKSRIRLLITSVVLVGIILVFLLRIILSQVFKKDTTAFPTLKKENVAKIHIINDALRTEVQKKDGRWTTTDFPADQGRINTMLNTLLSLKKEEIASKNNKKYDVFEVGGKKKIEINDNIIYLGKNASLSTSFVRFDKDPIVYIVSADFTDMLVQPDFRDISLHLVTDETKVDSLELVFNKKKIQLKKQNNEWVLEGGKKAKKDKINSLLQEIKNLKGDDMFKKKDVPQVRHDQSTLLTIVESGKTTKASFSQKNTDSFYGYKENAPYVYQVPFSYITSLQKEESDLVEE